MALSYCPITYIILGKALSIGQVVGIQGDGLVHVLQRQGILLQLGIIERLVEICLSRTRVYLPGMLRRDRRQQSGCPPHAVVPPR